MPWTNDVVLEFIDLYRGEQHLWDPKHPLHRNRQEISMAWTRIQSSLSIKVTVVELKRKKESLMTSFRYHFNRKKKTPDYCISWFAYSFMESFLGSKYECDSTNTNDLEDEFFSATTNYTQKETDNPISCRNVLPEKSNANKSFVRKKFKSEAVDMNQSDESAIFIKDLNYSKEDEDECGLYCQLLAKKLRRLDERQRDVAMHEIDNIMFHAKMKGGVSRTYCAPASPRKVKSPIYILTQNHGQYDDENVTYQGHIEEQPSE